MSATTSSSAKDTFVTVPGDRHAEVARTLAEPVPQALSLSDQFGLWGNLGVSLLGFTGAVFVLQPGGAGTPELSLAAALTAIVAGTLLGTTALALAGLPPSFDATRYHSLIVDEASLPPDLLITARGGGLPMGLRHARHQVEGVQFHPESILTAHGAALIRNFVRAGATPRSE